MLDPLLGQFVLVGGTALSLQIGHRKSVDLDMFTSLDFQASEILEHLDENGYQPLVLFNQKQTLIVEIHGIKVDFIRFKYPFAESTIVTDGIRLANIRDIACMKIDAIMGRGRKKDFCDLYYLLKRYSLSEIMEGYKIMYQHSTLFHVYKSLTWFDDADSDADLEVLDLAFDWEKVKIDIRDAVKSAV
jgi:hypothetical protein